MTPQHLGTLKALINRIIPPDDYPGGWDGGVGDYLARQFERDLVHLIPIYEMGLDALNAEAQAVYNLMFEALSTPSQDELLSRIEHGAVTTLWMIDPTAFFRMAVEHAAEGYYSDPGNGGNTSAVSWQMIGFQVRS